MNSSETTGKVARIVSDNSRTASTQLQAEYLKSSESASSRNSKKQKEIISLNTNGSSLLNLDNN